METCPWEGWGGGVWHSQCMGRGGGLWPWRAVGIMHHLPWRGHGVDRRTAGSSDMEEADCECQPSMCMSGGGAGVGRAGVAGGGGALLGGMYMWNSACTQLPWRGHGGAEQPRAEPHVWKNHGHASKPPSLCRQHGSMSSCLPAPPAGMYTSLWPFLEGGREAGDRRWPSWQCVLLVASWEGILSQQPWPSSRHSFVPQPGLPQLSAALAPAPATCTTCLLGGRNLMYLISRCMEGRSTQHGMASLPLTII